MPTVTRFGSILLAIAVPMAAHPAEPPAKITVEAKIDRRAVVRRHTVDLRQFSSIAPLQVGNGNFAFGADITGLQTFVPFATQSNWGWNSFPAPDGQTAADFAGQMVNDHGRSVWYPLVDPVRPALSLWMASNPHRVNLGRLGLTIHLKDGREAALADIASPRQTLDLWTGVIESHFTVEGVPVRVVTACDPKSDAIGVQIQSPLVAEGRLTAFIAVPGPEALYMAPLVGDWMHPLPLTPKEADAHRLQVRLNSLAYAIRVSPTVQLAPIAAGSGHIKVTRAEYGTDGHWADVTAVVAERAEPTHLQVLAGNNLAADPAPGLAKRLRVEYTIDGKPRRADCAEGANLILDGRSESNRWQIAPRASSDRLDFTVRYESAATTDPVPTPAAIVRASRAAWPRYWQSGGAIDLSGSADPRWRELERRVVLSQYQMAINASGQYPPQESGLVNNTWYGRWHMEMVWWHAAHWFLWNRSERASAMLDIYRKLLPSAMALAQRQGYAGARWPKCIGPDLTTWPNEIHAFLIWQQPHPIYFAELDYRAHPTPETLRKWAPIVQATADFMASFAWWDAGRNRYELGPPIHLVSENVDPYIAVNPTFELTYWRYALRIAGDWMHRLGQPRNPQWDQVLTRLSPAPQQDGVYVTYEGVPDMWSRYAFEHPGLIGALGMLPGDGIDRAVMGRTLDQVREEWDFNRTWGWDFPMLAMSAARQGRPEQAVDFLLHPAAGFQFDERGLATGGPFPYFPSNGGLLYAVAMMAAGWDGAPNRPAPGFPPNWQVRYESINPAP